MAKDDPVIGFRIPEELARAFKAAAALDGRPMQDIIAEAMREFVESRNGAAKPQAPASPYALTDERRAESERKYGKKEDYIVKTFDVAAESVPTYGADDGERKAN